MDFREDSRKLQKRHHRRSQGRDGEARRKESPPRRFRKGRVVIGLHYQPYFITMALDQKDLELIERIIYKGADDVDVAIARSFERLEERMDASESRLNSRLAEVEDKIAAAEHNLDGELNSIRDVLS